MNTLPELFEQWLTLTAASRTAKSAGEYRATYLDFDRWSKRPPVEGRLDRLVPENLAQFVTYLRNKCELSPNTINGRMSRVFRPFFNYLRQQGLIAVRPMEGVRLPPTQQTRQIAINRVELDRLLAVARDIADKARRKFFYDTFYEEFPSLILCAYHTGLRCGDCCHLTWDSIDLRNRSMVIRPDKRRHIAQVVEVPISDELHGHLVAWRESYHAEADGSYGWWEKTVNYVHPYLALRYDRTRGTLVSSLRNLFNLAGIKEGSFHGLRHGFVSRLLNAGVDPITVGSITGQSLVTVQRYAHVSLEAKRAALAKAYDAHRGLFNEASKEAIIEVGSLADCRSDDTKAA